MTALLAVVFDLDGTLFDHAGASGTAVRRFFAGLGVDASDAVVAAWGDAERRHFDRWRQGEIDFATQRRTRLADVLPFAGLSPPHDTDVADALFGRYLAEYRSAWRLFDGSVELVEQIRATGLRVGLLTNGTEEQQRDKLAVTGLDRHLDVVCSSEGIGAAKPDPAAFAAVATALGVHVAECLLVGDDPEVDVAGAHAAGMRAVLVEPARDGADGVRAAVWSAIRAAGGAGRP
ncbi:HAD family hydrolase [Curtobacterium sp. NPDC089185]|uniref:HAD family hydrolase n=1 Tax=Curtobacterium sp. NPDC089185 TaxID=3154968 RepID=UPI0034176D13